jgi:hypothetical protein
MCDREGERESLVLRVYSIVDPASESAYHEIAYARCLSQKKQSLEDSAPQNSEVLARAPRLILLKDSLSLVRVNIPTKNASMMLIKVEIGSDSCTEPALHRHRYLDFRIRTARAV